ncbi:glycosyltransferase family 8 protein [Metarhizium rileyi]|uniref:Glycosyltransferase family 8 protein n=1 Tax=Metarhizium rileyi (strain RCEF 4871) TaxID=1649241 RepID=A0A162JP81_METRR|nr:glycosyltransferase family 8 protein [Metarhizium rileyi RCEF 4871]TWU74692.1 N-acetylglucosaminyltransferase [Metarhizium rileyi]
MSPRQLRFILTVVAAVTTAVITLHFTYHGKNGLIGFPSSWSRSPQHDAPGTGAAMTVDWSRFAYVQYVTDSQYLCNSVMLFEILNRLGSKADRLMMFPASMAANGLSDGDSEDVRLLNMARERYNVRLHPIEVQHKSGSDPTWADSFTKLLAFNQTQYDRVLSLDSDSTLLQPVDELFLLPPCPVAMPRAYWLYPDARLLSSQVLLVQPSAREFERVMAEVDRAKDNHYDMDIVNTLYKDHASVLPHRPYDMLTGEFRRENHSQYLGSDRELWEPVAALNEAKFLHFSDWPVPKPWIQMSEELRTAHQPNCRQVDGAEHAFAFRRGTERYARTRDDINAEAAGSVFEDDAASEHCYEEQDV